MNVVVAVHAPFHAWTIPDTAVQRLRELFPSIRFVHARDANDLRRALPEADVAFVAEFDTLLLSEAPRLRWVHTSAVGVGRILSHAMIASDIVLTNSRGTQSLPIAEHVIALTLMLFHKLHVAGRRQSERVWAQDEISQTPPVRLLRGAHLAIVGLGTIGQEVARLASAMGMRVRGIRRRPSAGEPAAPFEAVHGPDGLHDALAWADVVVLAAPLTAETRGMIGAAEIRRMKPHAVLVNVGRGKLVNEAELVNELTRRTIAGAALDVVEHEPLDPDSPLWDLDNVIITPHTAGLRPDYWEVTVDLFAEHLRLFMAGKPLINVVDKRVGY